MTTKAKTFRVRWYQENYNTLRADLASGGVVGLFYDSRSGLRHIARYMPYGQGPRESFCGKARNFSPTGSQDKVCPDCLSLLEKSKILAQV